MEKELEVVNQFEGWSSEDLSKKSRDDHQEIVKELDKQDNALCLVVIGGICLVTALLFFILSFKRVKNKMAGIDPTSLQFFVFIGCTVAAAALLAVGITRTVKTVIRRKQLRQEIAIIAKTRVSNSNENK